MTGEHRSEAAVGWTWFASIMMLLLGFVWLTVGLIGVLEDDLLAATPNYVCKLDVTTWGWIHLLLGIVWLPRYPIWGIIFITVTMFVIWALTVHGRDGT